jgi:putative oligomerization/nucleic acid binding protein
MGLLGGMARTAVWAGTATAVSNRVSRRQYNRWAQQGDGFVSEPGGYSQAPEQNAPPPASGPSAGGEDRIEQLKSLADLKAQGVLTEQEFAAEKARILGS